MNFDRELRNRESVPSANHLIHVFNQFFSRYRFSQFTALIREVSSSFKLSEQFSYTLISHKVVAINIIHPKLNLGRITSFSKKKTNYGAFIFGGRFDYIRYTITSVAQQRLKGGSLPTGIVQCACAAYLHSNIACGTHRVALRMLKQNRSRNTPINWL